MIKKIFTFAMALLALTSCVNQSLEDTYKDYSGDGEIRYLGRCKDLAIHSGWNRLVVSWQNGVDPVIDSIKVVWAKDEMRDSVYVSKDLTEYSIEGLSDGSYEVILSSVDKNKNQSLTNTIYGRPYTENHETVLAFTRLISRQFFLHNRLILFFMGWEENVMSAYLSYTKADGTPGHLDITPELCNQLYYMLPDEIDESCPVTLYRTGYISDCEDLIVFSPTELENTRLFNAEFKQEMKRQFGFDGDISEEWATQVETISLDWNISNFADLLNLPNLKKLVLGRHRYLRATMVDDEEKSQSKIFEPELCDFVLNVLHELNGLTVERYNKHYKTLTPADYIIEKGMPSIPANYVFYNMQGAYFSPYPYSSNYDDHFSYLTDGDVSTSWKPLMQTASTSYQLSIDLNYPIDLAGIKIVQTYFDESVANDRIMCPNLFKIYVSNDAATWTSATYQEELELGCSSGETNIIEFTEGLKARFVIVVATTPYYYDGYYAISLAEMQLMKSK